MKFKKFVKVLSIGLLLGSMLVGCQNANAPYSEQKIVSIGEDKIYLDEMMYHVMIAEFQGKVIGSYFGGEAAYWASEYEDGVSMSENKQQEVLQDAIKYQVYYNAAVEEGLTLDDAEKAQVKQTVENMQKNIGDEAIKLTQLSSKQLEEISEKVALATKYYNDRIAKLQVDEEAIRSTINKEDYEIYKLQYLFMPSRSKNEAGQIEEVDAGMHEAIYEKMRSYREKFVAVAKLDDLVIANEDQGKMQTGEISFNEKNQPFGEEVEILEECKRLSGGETSNVFKTSMGYYVIRKIQDPVNPYEQAVKEAISSERERKMQEEYEMLKDQYRISINEKNWKNVHIGAMTTNSSF